MIPKVHFSQWFLYISWEQKLIILDFQGFMITPKKSHVNK